jgi:ATP-dependent DNA helicase PIF1
LFSSSSPWRRDPPLSKDQKAALRRAKDGKNLFITGRAGTGKTVLIRAIKRWAEGEKTVHVTSPTGAAALLIDGTTIHAWAGVGLGEKPIDYYIKLAEKQENKKKGRKKKLKSAFVETDLLIIDEISMVSWIGHLFLSKHT